ASDESKRKQVRTAGAAARSGCARRPTETVTAAARAWNDQALDLQDVREEEARVPSRRYQATSRESSDYPARAVVALARRSPHISRRRSARSRAPSGRGASSSARFEQIGARSSFWS